MLAMMVDLEDDDEWAMADELEDDDFDRYIPTRPSPRIDSLALYSVLYLFIYIVGLVMRLLGRVPWTELPVVWEEKSFYP